MNGIVNKPSLLSICIPTYNRDYMIRETLKLLCPITRLYNVNIYISDNASSDNTSTIVKEYVEKYSNIVYVRQKENLGPDKNFEYVLKMPTTKYRWLLGDSCYFDENSLCMILSELQEKDWDLFVVGSEDSARMKGIQPYVYTESNILLKELGWHLTWISCLIFDEKIVNNSNFNRYYNSRFIQTGVIFEYFIHNSCLVRVNPNIRVLAHNFLKRGSWESIAFEVFCKDWFLFVMSLPVFYSFEEKMTCIKKHGINSRLFTFWGLCTLRAKGFLKFSVYKQYSYFIKETISISPFLIFLLSISPQFIMVLMRKVMIKLRDFLKGK